MQYKLCKSSEFCRHTINNNVVGDREADRRSEEPVDLHLTGERDGCDASASSVPHSPSADERPDVSV